MIIHLGRPAEASLREHGFNIPQYPRTGKVSYEGNEVGHIDNFTGLVIDDINPEAVLAIVRLQDEISMGLWNIPFYATQETS